MLYFIRKLKIKLYIYAFFHLRMIANSTKTNTRSVNTDAISGFVAYEIFANEIIKTIKASSSPCIQHTSKAAPRSKYRRYSHPLPVARPFRARWTRAALHGIINSGQAAVTGQSLPTTTTWPKTWSFATWEQFQRWCLNWCRHSRSPSSAPSPTAGIACGAFLHCSRWLFARPGIRPQTAAPITIAPTTLQISHFYFLS